MTILIRLLFLTLILNLAQMANATDSTFACQSIHTKAVRACAAHEYAVNADALSIVSTETRQRVIRSEEAKLQSLKQSCLKIQKQCSLSCDEELESASIDGADLTIPLEKLNDCRQGEVARQIKLMDQKLGQLRRILAPKVGSRQILKRAANP